MMILYFDPREARVSARARIGCGSEARRASSSSSRNLMIYQPSCSSTPPSRVSAARVEGEFDHGGIRTLVGKTRSVGDQGVFTCTPIERASIRRNTQGFVAILIRLTSPGPILFKQERMGLDGKPFMMLKFRTMRSDHAGDHTLLTQKNDPRVTSIGSFLRSTSLDELPQFWNVLKGDMSIVGPRPERSWVVEEVRKQIPLYMLKHKMKAGITGWAQVNGWRGDTSLEKRIEFDLYYIEHWSLWLDLKIMWLTLWKGLIHKNAY